MKNIKISKLKFFILPIMIILIIIIYISLIMKNTPTYMNIGNIGFDIIFLILYFRFFIYEINIDSQGLDLKGLFMKKRILLSDLICLKQGGILTFIKTQKGRFFIVSSKKEKEVIKNVFKDI